MTRRRTSRGRSKRGYYWDGLQFPPTNIASTTSVFELVGSTAQEFMPATMVRIRGHLTLANNGSDASTAGVDCGLKIMYVEADDALLMTGDHQGIDTHEEDIAARQLWTYHDRLHERGTGTDTDGGKSTIDTVRIEIDVKVKIILVPSGKKLLVLLADASAANRLQLSGYIRCLLQHG